MSIRFQDIAGWLGLSALTQKSALALEIQRTSQRLFRLLLHGEARRSHLIVDGSLKEYTTILRGYGPLKRPDGYFHHYLFSVSDEWGEYEAIVRAPADENSFRPRFDPNKSLFLRIDSGCVSGQVLCDGTCECRQQLDIAIELLSKCEQGLIVRIPSQDGRGMGQGFKMASMVLQDRFGMDTIQAAKMLTQDGIIDRRTYAGAVSILDFLGVPKICDIHFATNNPIKDAALCENGYRIVLRVPILAPRTVENQRNLEAKKRYFGHAL